MKICQLAQIIDAQFVCGEENKDKEISSAFACDLMSDVLAYVNESNGVLLSGLANPQVVRTAAMMDMSCVVLVRNKKPDQKTIELAKQNDIVILQCQHNMYQTCGLLFNAGLRGDRA